MRGHSVKKYKNLVVDKVSRDVSINDKGVSLTVREFDILALIISNPRKVFIRANIFQSVWDGEFLADDNTVNVHDSNLRAKLALEDKETDYIQTVLGILFKLKE